ncbi:MAG: cobyrinate a,c-diamide synthase [Chlorobiaceae bacterium]|nr:cobyrinate a,c-diamide synthase [Chlorobiaceae bacterium]
MHGVNLPRLMISAPHKSSGKTLVSLGILSHFAGEGVRIRSFKKGPDYIDPMWHRFASGNECHNLDPYLMGRDGCIRSFLENSDAEHSSFSLVEGNHGLHDGLEIDGSDSSAGLAVMLNAPVLLVVDSSRLNRGIAAIVMGMQVMQPKASIAGVILNRVRNSRQEEKQKKAIEQLCKVPVLGSIPRDENLVIPERHLGLTTVGEMAGAERFVKAAAEKIAQHCDMKAIRALFLSAGTFPEHNIKKQDVQYAGKSRIGVFRDDAFCFYYPDNLRALREHGAELVFINSFLETALPDVDALYLGGGFPESFFDILSGNRALLKDVRERIESGMPVYAECGGLIYLCRSATYGGKTYDLAGVLPFEIGFERYPAGHGYIDLTSTTDSVWFRKGMRVKAHEFHYARALKPDVDCGYQFDAVRGNGITGKRDGALYRNVFASFAHLHALGNPEWAPNFVMLAETYGRQSSFSVS